MDKLKKVIGAAVFGTLFFSMFFSLMTSLAENINPIHVHSLYSLSEYSEVFIFDEDELEVTKELKAKSVTEKHVIPVVIIRFIHENLTFPVNKPEICISTEVMKEVFYPPKAAAV